MSAQADNGERCVSFVVAHHDALPPAQPQSRSNVRERSDDPAVSPQVVEVDPQIKR